MDEANYSKLSQRQIDRKETDILISLASVTQRGLAKMIGCHESKISRVDWRFMAAVMCGLGMESDVSPISKGFQEALRVVLGEKRKAPTVEVEANQISMQF